MQQFFFSASKEFGAEITRLLDFVHPATVALWNLRWQVQGFVAATGNATDDDLSERFGSGSGFPARNLKKSCIETPWAEQTEQFAQIVAANVIALYESWAEEVFSETINMNPKHKKWVQFPSRGVNGRRHEGIRDTLAEIRSAGISPEMRSAFFPVYSASKWNGVAHLDEMTVLYRYHKEIRNSFMHSGGRASDLAETAWSNVSGLTRADVGGRRNPILTQVTEGQRISYSMEQASDLAAVIIRLIHSIDAELSSSMYAEQYFLESWSSWSERGKYKELPSDPIQRDRRIAKICRKVGFVTPANPAAVIALGRKAGFVH
ncbi:hypothetical protein OHB31_35630 [Streptomyces microflavus]|uniref:hypothetical protein n=1 Tax=Streptomyces microflavus TaxID=1919 RepID=UPI002DDA7AB8|nr:hypothetical protein [Streptomyces microflavus]WSA58640.1 hypothetical protein OHB31_00010 [Streptomyces microflavus]WSA65170.1 hypothetical protein OHB31_35630 [Streptomyces microflavus]